MKKFSMNSMFRDVIEDERVVEILNQNFPMLLTNPRVSEAYDYTLKEIISDDMGAVVGIPKSVIKKVFNQIVELD